MQRRNLRTKAFSSRFLRVGVSTHLHARGRVTYDRQALQPRELRELLDSSVRYTWMQSESQARELRHPCHGSQTAHGRIHLAGDYIQVADKLHCHELLAGVDTKVSRSSPVSSVRHAALWAHPVLC